MSHEQDEIRAAGLRANIVFLRQFAANCDAAHMHNESYYARLSATRIETALSFVIPPMPEKEVRS